MKRFVLDASVALAWFIDDPMPRFAERVRQSLFRGGKALVPALWHLEMANGFLVARRRHTLAGDDIARAIQQIGLLMTTRIDSIPDLVPIRQAYEIALEFHLTAYDAIYLGTSLRQNLPLATLDKQLVAAATKAGVEIFSD